MTGDAADPQSDLASMVRELQRLRLFKGETLKQLDLVTHLENETFEKLVLLAEMKHPERKVKA